ncbi:uncharacterized protein HD556DRAFT_1449112 [Suillus plorans]|uniref:DUF6533 domain-containing protein n=1 Tax=Suillus plorans TaxID=116603 RepID=A0A9P7AD62_9AGAM|nr:uncharacterized protein HD556DRAFT_1449112 [Suillus plorans]KAG1787058.1 hypothetical protein HD556DRAFT_1449112 [Suillus plorans]
MTIFSNDPAWWPTINAYRFSSYFSVAAFVVVTYDWALTFAQEVELVWRQRWSLMTVLYLGVRYLGILYAAYVRKPDHPVPYSDPLADKYSESSAQMSAIPLQLTVVPCRNVSWIVYVVWNWTGVVIFALLWVTIITRLYAMYQRSRKILISLVVTFLVLNIFDGVVAVMAMVHASGEEIVFSGAHQCWITFTGDILFLNSVTWILGTVWEVSALCLAVWIAVKHFRELRQHSAGGIIGECFTVLMKTHVLYFASFVAVSCFTLVLDFSPTFSTLQNSLGIQTFYGLLQILEIMQLFVLGPRLILGVREYGAKLVADSNTAIASIRALRKSLLSSSVIHDHPSTVSDRSSSIRSSISICFLLFFGGGLGNGGGGVRQLGWSGAIRESIVREDFTNGELEGLFENGEFGCELTRRMSSDIGVDLGLMLKAGDWRVTDRACFGGAATLFGEIF